MLTFLLLDCLNIASLWCIVDERVPTPMGRITYYSTAEPKHLVTRTQAEPESLSFPFDNVEEGGLLLYQSPTFFCDDSCWSLLQSERGVPYFLRILSPEATKRLLPQICWAVKQVIDLSALLKKRNPRQRDETR